MKKFYIFYYIFYALALVSIIVGVFVIEKSTVPLCFGIGAFIPLMIRILFKHLSKPVAVVDPHFGHGSYDLGFWQRLSLSLFGRAKICNWAKEGWTGELPFYIVECEKHGYFVDYVHGHRSYFSCPKCDDETVQSWASQAKSLNV